jgi:hypothetical protein
MVYSRGQLSQPRIDPHVKTVSTGTWNTWQLSSLYLSLAFLLKFTRVFHGLELSN